MDGFSVRLNRILRPDTGRSLVVAIDHGMALGPLTGLKNVKETVSRLDATGLVDAWLVTKGIYRHAFEPVNKPGIILRISGGATISGPELTREGQTATLEDALAAGADAIATSAFIGSPYEHETLIGLARAASECRKWNMPLLGVVGLGKINEEQKKDARFIALGARAAAEHGADLVKTYYTEEGFEQVTAGCPVPILIAGGPKCETDLDTLKMIAGALDGGAKGIVMGRNVWQSPHPEALLAAVHGLIHRGFSVQEANDLLEAGVNRR
ncbi:fructose-bisphosphate aldolase [Pelotomaculum terephthalicicum JT]|uniref:class I fructose-bisphosphate aldolase n=1 Tax=Pelotomaculum TaxID=191373 RepID=UPI0009CE35A3|nr:MULTISPECIES: fructose-bisphosphate aldolase [Pelotomaculum]MCG9968202.1 fructose-bisphosphate aldolase [Pelotomaculum terephthalicicum JT]OPX89107.1 MAG: putative aldolase LsrF [Pelotomaculum sp. PtaB.Bin117]OPY59977.1 MAG: putative aldolase LsrF [Pelotomaculum sp. PtaU1.Bin065]